MSIIKATALLKDVKPYKQGWRVQVKLLHSWRQKTNYGGDTLEMIFADETVRLLLYVLCSLYLFLYVLCLFTKLNDLFFSGCKDTLFGQEESYTKNS